MWGTEVTPESTGSQVPLAQNNPHTTEAHLGVAGSEPLNTVPKILSIHRYPEEGWERPGEDLGDVGQR